MARVEWTRLSGEEVEDLVAVLLCLKSPNATRIRPSRGDGGIDLMVPIEGTFEVYQVKKFASNLASSQKNQIKKSLDRFKTYRKEEGLKVFAWHIALPLDPTKENTRWLEEISKDLPYNCDWRGLSYLDGLAAEFPDVVDYYVGNGRQRLDDAIVQLTKAMEMKPNEGEGVVSPSQLADYLQELKPLLDKDPFFQYEVSVGPEKSSISPGAVLLMSYEGGRGNLVKVQVFPRFQEALKFRPIPVDIVIKAKRGSELERELDDFNKYGTPVFVPVGMADVKADLPGGLEGSATGVGLSILTPNDDSEPMCLRAATLNTDNEVIASILVEMEPATIGVDGSGKRSVGVGQGGAFKVDLRLDSDKKMMKIDINSVHLAKKAPHDVIDSLRFLCSLIPPNKLKIGRQYGSLTNTIDLPQNFAGLEGLADLIELKEAVESLVVIQDHTPIQISIPDSFTKEQSSKWHAAKRLLEGEEIDVPAREFKVCLRPGVSLPKGELSVVSLFDFSVTVGNTDIPLGKVRTLYSVAKVDTTSYESHDDHKDCFIRPTDKAKSTMRMETE